jgi:hypothetical protein
VTDPSRSIPPSGSALRTLVYAASLAAVAAAHLAPLLGGKLASVDEGYAMALASRLLDGHPLYVEAVSQRGPLLYAVYALLAATFGWTSVGAVRWAALGFAVATVLVVARTARARERAGAVLAIAYVLSLGLEPYDGVALHAELMMLPVLAAAAFATMRAPRRGIAWALLAGTLFGVATCFKQPASVCALPAAIFIALRARTWRAAALQVGALAIGAVAPVLVFVLRAAAHGELAAFWYQTVTYNLTIHRAGARPLAEWAHAVGHVPQAPLLAASLVVVAANATSAVVHLGRRLPRGRRFVAFGCIDVYLFVSALFCVLAAAAYRQRFGHYFLPAAPFVALGLARAVGRLRGGLAVRVGLVAGALGCFAASGERMVDWLAQADGRVAHGETIEHLARYVQKSTSPTDRLFVWGFAPQIYPYSHRRPATRYFFETYVTGFVPWLYDDLPLEPTRVVPGSMDALLGDLEREKPAVIVDAGSVQIARSMRAYPEAAEYLHEHYCFDARLGAFDVYRRRTAPACESTCFPLLAPPVDYWDAPMGVPSPAALDDQAARWLGRAPFPALQSFARGVSCASWP